MNRYTKIVDHVYLGSYNDLIKQYVVDIHPKAVINVAVECNNVLSYDTAIDYYHYLYNDRPSDKISNAFDEIADLIHEYAVAKKNVFIHCYAGRSRSASFALVYLMKYEHYTLRDAYNYVDKLRGIYPNLGFINQLMEYEVVLTGQSTLDYDALCVDYIHSTIGGTFTAADVAEAYYACDKNVDETMDTLFAQRRT